MKRIWLTYFIFSIFASISFAQFQNHYSLFERSFVLEIDSALANYALPDSFLIQHSESLFQDSVKLESGIDYQMDYVKGEISFLKRIPVSTKINIS